MRILAASICVVSIEFCPDFFLNGERYYDCAEWELVYSNIESAGGKNCFSFDVLDWDPVSLISYLVRL